MTIEKNERPTRYFVELFELKNSSQDEVPFQIVIGRVYVTRKFGHRVSIKVKDCTIKDFSFLLLFNPNLKNVKSVRQRRQMHSFFSVQYGARNGPELPLVGRRALIGRVEICDARLTASLIHKQRIFQILIAAHTYDDCVVLLAKRFPSLVLKSGRSKDKNIWFVISRFLALNVDAK